MTRNSTIRDRPVEVDGPLFYTRSMPFDDLDASHPTGDTHDSQTDKGMERTPKNIT